MNDRSSLRNACIVFAVTSLVVIAGFAAGVVLALIVSVL